MPKKKRPPVATKMAERKFVLPDKAQWMSRGWQPCYIGFCPSEKAWHAMCRMMKVPLCEYPTNDAGMTRFRYEEHKECFVVTANQKLDQKYRSGSTVSVSALILHECVHVWQAVLSHMHEKDKPGGEIEAYSIQAIFIEVMSAYLDTRIRRRKVR